MSLTDASPDTAMPSLPLPPEPPPAPPPPPPPPAPPPPELPDPACDGPLGVLSASVGVLELAALPVATDPATEYELMSFVALAFTTRSPPALTRPVAGNRSAEPISLPRYARTSLRMKLSDTDRPTPTSFDSTTPPVMARLLSVESAFTFTAPPASSFALSSTRAAVLLRTMLSETAPSTPILSDLPPATVTVTSWFLEVAFTSMLPPASTSASSWIEALALPMTSMMLTDPPNAALPPELPRILGEMMPTTSMELTSFAAFTLTAWAALSKAVSWLTFAPLPIHARASLSKVVIDSPTARPRPSLPLAELSAYDVSARSSRLPCR